MFLRNFPMIAALAVRALAQTTIVATDNSNFPPFGLGSGETARINLTNVAANSSSGTAASCTGSVSFVNAAGTTIGAATSYTIPSGQTASFSLAFASAGLTGNRGQIRAVIQSTRSSTTNAPCSLLFSLETFDTSSGATHIYVSGSDLFELHGGGHRQ